MSHRFPPPAVVAAGLVAMLATPASAAEYVQTAGSASTLVFASRYDGELFTGRFPGFSTRLSFDPAKPAEGKLEVTIPLAGAVSEFSSVLSDLAEDLGERSTRQHAVDRTLEAVRKLNRDKAEDSLEREAILAARIVAADIMTFAGADPSEALAAARAGTGNFDIPAPPPAPRLPFGLRRRRSR